MRRPGGQKASASIWTVAMCQKGLRGAGNTEPRTGPPSHLVPSGQSFSDFLNTTLPGLLSLGDL
jgi:hypothetical protein